MANEAFLAPILFAFRADVNSNFPHRDKASDGWIGNAAHAATKSEHNPCWTCPGYLRGIVRAVDIDIDDNDRGRDLRKEIISAAVGHRSVWYVISNGIIWSRTFNWKPRKYTGPNKHTQHVHISCWITVAAAKDLTLKLRRPTPAQPPTKPPVKDEEMPLNDADKTAIRAIVVDVVRDYALWEALYGLETEDEKAEAREAYSTARAAGKTAEEARAVAAGVLSSLREAIKKSQSE